MTATGTITDVNNSPDAINDAPTTVLQEDVGGTTIVGNVILGGTGNVADTDPNNDALSITGLVAGTGAVLGLTTIGGLVTVSGTFGTLQIAADGSYTYTLDNSRIATQNMLGGQNYVDVFTYKITDGNGGYDTATITANLLGTLDATAITPQPVAINADGLSGYYYGYNDTAIVGNRVHSDDLTATALGSSTNIESVEDVSIIINGRNGSNVVGTNADATINSADVKFSVRTLSYGFSPNVNSSLGSNAVITAGSALNAPDGNVNSTAAALANFLDQDQPTAIVQTGTGGGSGLGTTTDGIIRMSGNVYLERGNYDFRVVADDGFRLKVGGETLIEFDGNQPPTLRYYYNVEVNDLISGLTAIELLYWEQGGNAKLQFDFKPTSSSAWVPFSLDTIAFFSVANTPVLTDTRIQDIVETSVNQQYELRTGSVLDGDSFANTLTGNVGRDFIQGLGGDDILYGYNPADLPAVQAKDSADFLAGGAGNDQLFGGYGNDILDGGTGDDTMTGGFGDDIFRIDSALDVAIENANEGTDTIEIEASYNLGATPYVLGTNFENILLKGSFNENATGNASANRITGNDGDNILSGLAGDDRLIGGKGNDTLSGGTGNDIFEWNLTDKGAPGAPAIDVITDFTYALGSYGAAGTVDGLANVYNPANLRADAIDLRDLLVGEASAQQNWAGTANIGTLLNYIDVIFNAGTGNTEMRISSTGGFTGVTGIYNAAVEDQRIIFSNVNLFTAGVTSNNETELLQKLLFNGTLVVD